MLAKYLMLSGILFSIGALGAMTRRNFIIVLLSIEIMLNAANLAFVSFSSFSQNATGQAIVLFVIAVAACEVAIGLSIAVLFFRKKGTIDTYEFNLLKW